MYVLQNQDKNKANRNGNYKVVCALSAIKVLAKYRLLFKEVRLEESHHTSSDFDPFSSFCYTESADERQGLSHWVIGNLTAK